MVVHREKREMAVVVPEAAGASGQLRGGDAASGGGTVRTSPNGDSRITPGADGNLHVETAHMTMPAFADLLNGFADRPVLDFTGIEGRFDSELDVPRPRRPGPPGADAASDPAGVSLFTSLQKLGLRLEARKAPVEVLVLDRADKVPVEN